MPNELNELAVRQQRGVLAFGNVGGARHTLTEAKNGPSHNGDKRGPGTWHLSALLSGTLLDVKPKAAALNGITGIAEVSTGQQPIWSFARATKQ